MLEKNLINPNPNNCENTFQFYSPKIFQFCDGTLNAFKFEWVKRKKKLR